MLQIFDKKDTGKPFSYLLTLPEGFDKEKESLPLIVFLHGAGERGDNPETVPGDLAGPGNHLFSPMPAKPNLEYADLSAESHDR